MNYHTARTNYLKQLIAIYKSTPSLAIWRALEARAFDGIIFDPPTLDLACGTGQFARVLLGNKMIAGCDLDENAIRVAVTQKTLDVLCVADARELPYPQCEFHSVLANCALEHIPDVERVFAEIARVLKPLGIFAFTVPSDHFNEFLLFPKLYQFLGLRSRARKHIQWYNAIQQHQHIDPLSIWKERLHTVGFKFLLHRYYMPRLASFIFSTWDVLDKWTLLSKNNRQIHLQEFLLNRIPDRILFWVLYCHFVRFYKSSSNTESGSGLLLVARKESDPC